jgi:flagellar basal-body rod protein FlgF
MENSIYLGLSKQMVLRTNMNITANNIANVNTPGFRGQNTLFAEFIADPRGDDSIGDPLSFVNDRGQYQITDEGPLQQTDNPLDIAIVGPGFIGVQGPSGSPSYSRAGNLQLGLNGQLQTSAGYPVLNEGGAPITIPADASEIKIDSKGVISSQQGQISRIKLVEFQNIQELKPEGDNLYTTTATANPATQSTVKQGYVEGSNVQAVLEMTNMIDTLRNYQSVQNMMQSENERLRGAIQRLTRSS